MSVTVPIVSAMAALSGWRIERLPVTHPDAALLVEEEQGEHVARYGGGDQKPIDPTYFDEPAAAFFAAYLDNHPVATRARRRPTAEAGGAASPSAADERVNADP